MLLGEDIGKSRRKAVIVKAPVQDVEGQHQRIVGAGFAERSQLTVIAGDEIAGLKSGGIAEGQILAIAPAEPDPGIGIGSDLGVLAIEAELQLEQAGGRQNIGARSTELNRAARSDQG